MKYLAVVAVLALVGCQQAMPPKPQPTQRPMTKSEYVAANRCELESTWGGSRFYGDDGTTHTSSIVVVYRCPNGVSVIIDSEAK